ncbi:MAG: hypothetical protein IJC83_04420 [Oscillospiraceae bacterium]|nr:hypothetical protein [Oscillospiraceae bacterium]
MSLLAEAKVTHDEIEKHYIGAMNFAEVDKITAEVLEKIESTKKSPIL